MSEFFIDLLNLINILTCLRFKALMLARDFRVFFQTLLVVSLPFTMCHECFSQSKGINFGCFILHKFLLIY
jgi:hypothetical protein